MDIIYFDNAATTKTSEAVRARIEQAEREFYFNSAALYNPSLNVKREIDRANAVIKKRLVPSAFGRQDLHTDGLGNAGTSAGGGEVIFTSGATEGNNMVILGKITNQRNHLLVAAGEHSSVYAPSVNLKNNGFEVDYVPLLPSGEIDTYAIKSLVKPNTALFVFGMVNSDTGTLQNAAEIVRIVKAANPRTHVHCDATQAFCKFPFDAAALGLDSVVISAHKVYGPKGVGALWLRKGTNLKPIMFGGAQQEYRPGTENNAAILGFAAAVENFDTAKNYDHVKMLHERLIRGLPINCTINGNNLNPYITNIQLPRAVGAATSRKHYFDNPDSKGVLGQTVLNALSLRGICVGLGSACASTASKNRTLLAMGIPEAETKQVLRVSFGIYNTVAEVDIFLRSLQEILAKLK